MVNEPGDGFKFWRYSALDFFLLLPALLQLALMTSWAVMFQQLPMWANIALIAPASLMFYFNPIVITHNFLHTPFFQWSPLNRLFAIVNSGNMLLPQSIYKHHHLLHHKFNNDPIADGTTQDPSSTYRYGRNGEQEGMVAYCALSLLRDSTKFAYAELVRKGDRPQFFMELSFLTMTLIGWGLINWQFLLVVAVPVFYLGFFLAHMENYYEHYHAQNSASRHANSVSYLGPIYNFFMFNEGFHQAHHIEPGRHWTRRPEIHERHAVSMAEQHAKVAAWPPLLGFLEGSTEAASKP